MSFIKNLRYKIILIVCLAVVNVFSSSFAYDINKNVEVSDPIEPVNRAVYGFNRFLDKILLKPVAKGYRYIVPEVGRKGVRNVLRNLGEPVNFVNSIFQADKEHSFTTFWRFTLNTTIGIGGLFDIAQKNGLEYRKEDFGQTAGTYGTGHGPYIMLPIFGPSNTRDVFGIVVDVFTDPFNYAFNDYLTAGRVVAKGIDKREANIELIEEIDRVSIDPYAATRSLYTQKREDQINNGK